jgi:hypothetical protein
LNDGSAPNKYFISDLNPTVASPSGIKYRIIINYDLPTELYQLRVPNNYVTANDEPPTHFSKERGVDVSAKDQP